MNFLKNDMKQTIEERAKEYADKFTKGESSILAETIHKVAEIAYTAGATEQHKIDFGKIDDDCEGCDLCRKVYHEKFIERADKWLRSHLPRVIGNYPRGDNETTVMLNEDMRAEFREDMEK